MDHGGDLLCSREEKAAKETQNGVDQIDFITHLVDQLGIKAIRESHLRDFQRIAVNGIYPCAGKYRDAYTKVHIEGSAHQLPDANRVPGLVLDLIEYLNDSKDAATHRAAYGLWRLNWIHPFKGGNGRTARALCYLVVCMDMGRMLPGRTNTVPYLILGRRHEYIAALRAADASVTDMDTGTPDLSVMEAYVTDVVTQQLAHAIDQLSKGH